MLGVPTFLGLVEKAKGTANSDTRRHPLGFTHMGSNSAVPGRSQKCEVKCEAEHIQPLPGNARVDPCRVQGPAETQKARGAAAGGGGAVGMVLVVAVAVVVAVFQEHVRTCGRVPALGCPEDHRGQDPHTHRGGELLQQ